MERGTPITDAVYGKRSTRRKPERRPPRRQPNSLVRDRLRPELVAEIERRFRLTRRGSRPSK